MMKNIVRVFALNAAASAGVVIGMAISATLLTKRISVNITKTDAPDSKN